MTLWSLDWSDPSEALGAVLSTLLVVLFAWEAIRSRWFPRGDPRLLGTVRGHTLVAVGAATLYAFKYLVAADLGWAEIGLEVLAWVSVFVGLRGNTRANKARSEHAPSVAEAHGSG